MLRRYLIVNGISTALMYGAFLTFTPSMTSIIENARRTVYSYAVDGALLAPLVYRMAVDAVGRR